MCAIAHDIMSWLLVRTMTKYIQNVVFISCIIMNISERIVIRGINRIWIDMQYWTSYMCIPSKCLTCLCLQA